jgi:hypothetical protein
MNIGIWRTYPARMPPRRGSPSTKLTRSSIVFCLALEWLANFRFPNYLLIAIGQAGTPLHMDRQLLAVQ